MSVPLWLIGFLLPVAYVVTYPYVKKYFKSRKWLVVYFNDEDYETAYTLAKILRADVKKMEKTLPPESDEYQYIALIGKNPIYWRLVKEGKLPRVTPQVRKVVRVIDNMVFIVGWSPSDTFDAMSDFVRLYLRRVRIQ